MKFNVGNRIRFVKKIINHSTKVKLGEIYQIKDINSRSSVPYKIENGEWFSEEELTLPEYTYEDLKKSSIGTKITFEKGEVLVKDDDGNYSNKKRWRDDSDLKELKDRLNTLGKIIKIEEPTYETVYEYKPEILDEAEKRYLKGVIRPYLDRIKSIEKFIFSTGRAKIKITVKDDDSYWYINLPPFEKDTMYKNMKDDKEYTLEELGL